MAIGLAFMLGGAGVLRAADTTGTTTTGTILTGDTTTTVSTATTTETTAKLPMSTGLTSVTRNLERAG